MEIKVDKQVRRLGRRTLTLFKEKDPEAESRTKRGATCSKGCSACCNLLAIVTLPEAILIARDQLTKPEQIPKLYNEIANNLKALADPNITRRSYFNQSIPCIFLQADKSCGIYELRPSACRYHAVVSHPANCSWDSKDPNVLRIDMRDIEDDILKELAHTSKQVGLPLLAGPMPVMMLWALRLLAEGVEEFHKALEDPQLGILDPRYWMRAFINGSELGKDIAQGRSTEQRMTIQLGTGTVAATSFKLSK